MTMTNDDESKDKSKLFQLANMDVKNVSGKRYPINPIPTFRSQQIKTLEYYLFNNGKY